MIEDKIKFLDWLINRLVYKHAYSEKDIIIQTLKEIKLSYHYSQISDSQLDQIIIKYYPDFHMDLAEDINIGYTDNQRNSFRKTIRSILQDILGTFNKE